MYRLLSLFIFIPFLSLAQPGCVSIRGNYLFMRQTEVSNLDYNQFLSHLSPEEKANHYPDTSKWKGNVSEAVMSTYYFKHPAYQNYPVVNVTYDNAVAYCKWLTQTLNHNYPDREVLVRLPTEKEWEEAAKAGNKSAIYPWGTESMRVAEGKYKGKFQANFVLKKGFTMMDGAAITSPVISYWPNPYGLYCMSGNVSEMVEEQHLVKGGSWRNRADWLRIDKKQYVYGASPEVGFRYVIEMTQLPQPKKDPKGLILNKKFFKKYFATVNDSLSIGKFEVTNALYSLYLSLLDPLNRWARNVQDTNWNGLFPYSQFWMRNYSSHANFKNHPVVNISSTSAHLFALWLGDQYRKVVGESVEIRLPTEQEWIIAARGNSEKGVYPWGGTYIRNSKGCFLANFNPKINEDENVFGYDTLTLNNFFKSHFTDLNDFDGEAVIAPVDSYFPNDYGIYNLSGNVSEIVGSAQYTKGGSWKSKSYFLQIDAKEKWDGKPNPFVGFRVALIRGKSS